MASSLRAQIDRRAALAGLAATALASRSSAAPAPFALRGRPQQGGYVIGEAAPGAVVRLNGGQVTEVSPAGLFVVGFDRDEAAEAELAVGDLSQRLAIAPVTYDVQAINGLPPDQVTPTDPVLLARIKAELAVKQAALAHVEPADDYARGYILPVENAIRTSKFGPQRILNGVPKPPHYGVDLAAPEGTPIRAPAGGRVVLAEPDMWFEGGLTLIDHGQGMIGLFLHQSRLDVAAGQRVEQGQTIGLVGHKGRATGPHLCWRQTWRGRHMDPSLMVGAPPRLRPAA